MLLEIKKKRAYNKNSTSSHLQIYLPRENL